MKLEKMEEFFDSRLDGYEDHQLNAIDSAKIFYPYTASQLPMAEGCKVLDLGCGTGLELNEYFMFNPLAVITGIDLANGMLNTLQAKFPDKQLTLINGSYFEVPFGENVFDAAVSVESLHHFTLEQKILLYKKLHGSLKEGGYFILTDYMAENDEEEKNNFLELSRLKKELGICDGEFYHYDTPLTRAHETEALLSGGFSKVGLLNKWQSTNILKAYK
ncbi:class I SAM-dependent methyltransferase [Lacrimispora sphenoides]|uniref:tRNA (Cmo5U34)-methyltransferase n=1 Tax=Lacrimispora sphenoides JCM 1415 TaxID=1297793 RepID=A0ABY1C9I9_9FIRM|nr:class I SAM-dependent methyltransferase [Lacrimispora sphenoides]SET82895.1 tRNA (cmo5U34)-methyltransferase [[Clostridium] sphenoides JCM 1415]SUY51592.1 SAM-dependent methyltransferase [Lacrimispora sphenoides]